MGKPRREIGRNDQEALPEHLNAQIVETIAPKSPGRLVMIRIASKPTVPETRNAMFAWCKSFKECKIELALPDEHGSRQTTAAPSKPFELGKRDALVLCLMSGIKLLAGPERAREVTPDLANGRVFVNRTMVVDRKSRDQPPAPIMDAITTLFPGTTEA